MDTVAIHRLTLKQWRALKGMTQAELAEKSNVDISTISKYDTNPSAMANANYKTLKKLAKALGINVDNFFID